MVAEFQWLTLAIFFSAHGLGIKVMFYMTLINMTVFNLLCWHNSSMLKVTYYAQNNASINVEELA